MKLSKTQQHVLALITDVANDPRKVEDGRWILEANITEANNHKAILSATIWKLARLGLIEVQVYREMVSYEKSYNFGQHVSHCTRPETYYKVRLNTTGNAQKEVSYFCSSAILAPANATIVPTDRRNGFREWVKAL